MYTAYRSQIKRRVFVRFALYSLPFLAILGFIIWLIFLKQQPTTTTNFAKEGAQVAVVKPEKVVFDDSGLFKITLPSSWGKNGRKNPFTNQVYYEYQSRAKNYDNRWLRIYVDVYPTNFAVSRVLPVSIKQNRVVIESPESVSDECWTFTGAPLANNGDDSGAGQTWAAKWKNINFTCDMNKNRNYVGAVSESEGYGLTMVSANGDKHKYFFVYIDNNVRPDFEIFTDSITTFETM